MSGFRHLGDRLVHQGYIWHVAVAEYESPDGERFQRDIVRSPGAVAAVPLRVAADGSARVVLVRQYRPPFDDFVIEVPAGMRDVPGEPTEMYPSAGMTDSVLTLYLATDLTEVPRDTHGPEEAHMEVLDLALGDAVEMVLNGTIHDAKTVVGLLLVERRLREGGHG